MFGYEMTDNVTPASEVAATGRVFLSHAGEDADLSRRLASEITKILAQTGRQVTVFNTSDPAHRYHDFIDTVRAGERWDSSKWEEELRAYLRSNIQESAAYLLLVTPISIEKDSRWIQFEIEVAAELHRTQGILYIPCAYGQQCLSRLPETARVFQGVDVSDDRGIAMLCGVLDRILP